MSMRNVIEVNQEGVDIEVFKFSILLYSVIKRLIKLNFALNRHYNNLNDD
jgi:hypothetical protein